MRPIKLPRPDEGSILTAVLFVVVALGAITTSIMMSATGSTRATSQNTLETRLLYQAESGINFHTMALASDSFAIVKDTTVFPTASIDLVNGEYVGIQQQITTTGDIARSFIIRAQYLNGTTPVIFTSRTDPVEEWTTLKITSTATVGSVERQVAAWYELELGDIFNSAVMSDAASTGTGGNAKANAKQGNIIIANKGRSTPQHYIYGGLSANGEVSYYENGSLTADLTNGNVSTYLDGWEGEVESQLNGTPSEIPDFTELGGANQLFDFGRFEAAASAGAGQVFNTLADFAAAQNAANAASQPLEGIIYINVNSAAEGNDPKIETSGGNAIPGGINVVGTLVFSFSNGTSPNYKVFIKVPLNINAADMTGFDPADQETFNTGYPPAYSTSATEPWDVDITPSYENFVAGDGMPALMFDNAVVDIHDAANVCGVVYGPSFIEIENKGGNTQFFNGSIIGGGGILLEGNSSSGVTAIKFDPAVLENLQTMGSKGKTLTRVGYAILK